MRMTEISFAGATPIDGYGPGFFRVAGQVLEGAMCVTRLEDAGIGVETMNSPAACRTYNVLLSEGRRVAVALLPV